MARPGVEAAAWLAPLGVAGRAQPAAWLVPLALAGRPQEAAWVVAPTVAAGRPQAAVIAEKSLSPEPKDHVLFVKVLVADLERGAFNTEGFEAKRAIERLRCDLAGGYA